MTDTPWSEDGPWLTRREVVDGPPPVCTRAAQAIHRR
jgi:hypothetical protein